MRAPPRLHWLLVLCLAPASCSAEQGGPWDETVASIDSLLTAAVEAQQVPGAVVRITHGEEVLLDRAYGFARLYDFDGDRLAEPEPMTVDHLFDLASVTKVLATTFGVMLLVDRGAVDLDAPVRVYLPEFRGASKDSVTVRHLLTHTAGLTPWKPLYYHASDARETYRYICGLELAYPVGAGRRYSDLGFMLLGYLVEEVSGRTLDVFLEEELYGPLGLRRTAFNPKQRGLGPFAATSHGNPFERRMVADDGFGYVCDEDPDAFRGWRAYTLVGEVNDGNAFHAHGGVAGHAGLFSTSADMQVLVDLLRGGGAYGGSRYLSGKEVDEFLTPDRHGSGLGWAMAPGMLALETVPAGSFGHTGFTGTYVLVVPAYDLSVILLTNRQNVGVDASGRYPSVDGLRRAVAKRLIDAAEEVE